MRPVRRTRLGLPVLLPFLLALPVAVHSPARAKTHKAASTRPSLEGRVLSPSGGRTAAGAVVIAVHLDSGAIFKSPPTGAGGEFTIGDLPFGYYEFAIQADGVLHAARGVFNLEPSRRAHLDFRLLGPEAQGRDAAAPEFGLSPVPGLGGPATGRAEIVGLQEGPPFFRTPAGIATIVGGSAILLLLVR